MKVTRYESVDRSALQYFKGCHDRVRDGKSPSIVWPRDKDGYLAFLAEIGPLPKDMIKPSVGRIDHSLGYQPGNLRWEEFRVNSVKRRGTKHFGSVAMEIEFRQLEPTFRIGTEEHREHQKKASRARWAKEGSRDRSSNLLLNNKHAARKW